MTNTSEEIRPSGVAHPGSRTGAWVWGLAAGTVVALVDVAVIKAVDPGAATHVLAQAFLFWASAGLLVVIAESKLGRFSHGIVFSIVLSLPWYVHHVVSTKNYAHLPPLLIQGVLFGLLFGYVRGRVRGRPASAGRFEQSSSSCSVSR